MTMIRSDMTIAEVLKMRHDAASILLSHGMHCLGCSVSASESLLDAAQVHSIDVQALLRELNRGL